MRQSNAFLSCSTVRLHCCRTGGTGSGFQRQSHRQERKGSKQQTHDSLHCQGTNTNDWPCGATSQRCIGAVQRLAALLRHKHQCETLHQSNDSRSSPWCEGPKALEYFFSVSPSESTRFVSCSTEALWDSSLVWAFHNPSYTQRSLVISTSALCGDVGVRALACRARAQHRWKQPQHQAPPTMNVS